MPYRKPASVPKRSKAEPCTRPVGEQSHDRTGAARPTDHPALNRIELLSDAQLDALRARFPSRTKDGSDEYDALIASVARSDASRSRLRALADRLPYRPVASFVVCTVCGQRGYLTAERPWDVDRAMARLGASERDVLAVRALLDDPAGLPPEPARWVRDRGQGGLDAFSTEELRELLALASGA